MPKQNQINNILEHHALKTLFQGSERFGTVFILLIGNTNNHHSKKLSNVPSTKTTIPFIANTKTKPLPFKVPYDMACQIN